MKTFFYLYMHSFSPKKCGLVPLLLIDNEQAITALVNVASPVYQISFRLLGVSLHLRQFRTGRQYIKDMKKC